MDFTDQPFLQLPQVPCLGAGGISTDWLASYGAEPPWATLSGSHYLSVHTCPQILKDPESHPVP